ncbi:MAG TPA: tetratricopeptide repeat protein [Anaerolineales bacterium]|nr:tetratricopeptide repeat protein [Anaerolineales bacterium]
MGQIQKTVFISYRHANSSWALAIYQDLTLHGFDVFIDFEGIKSGEFERTIIENIKSRAHFVVVLTPSALKRCTNPDDWLRREIETAFECGRNIVPLMIEGFNFSNPRNEKFMTGKLAVLKKVQGLDVPVNLRYFKYAMKELRENFLNVELDAVLQPPSDMALNAATVQQALANMAAQIEQADLSAQQWFEKAFTFEEEGDLDKAIECYSQAIRFNPYFAEAYINRGSLYSFNDLDRAYSNYDSVIRFRPDHAEALNNRGLIYQMKGDLEHAALDFQKSLRSKPDDGNVRSSLMVVLRLLGRMDEADEQEKLARELLRTDDEYDQACFEAICGNLSRALELLKAALDNEQCTKEWAQQDPHFASIRNEPEFIRLAEG